MFPALLDSISFWSAYIDHQWACTSWMRGSIKTQSSPTKPFWLWNGSLEWCVEPTDKSKLWWRKLWWRLITRSKHHTLTLLSRLVECIQHVVRTRISLVECRKSSNRDSSAAINFNDNSQPRARAYRVWTESTHQREINHIVIPTIAMRLASNEQPEGYEDSC